jgi:hypothetical protein
MSELINRLAYDRLAGSRLVLVFVVGSALGASAAAGVLAALALS